MPCRALAVATKHVCCGWNVQEWNEPSNDSATTIDGWSCSAADEAERKSYKWTWPSSVPAMNTSFCWGWIDKELIGDDSRNTSTNSSEWLPFDPLGIIIQINLNNSSIYWCCFSISCTKICSSFPLRQKSRSQFKEMNHSPYSPAEITRRFWWSNLIENILLKCVALRAIGDRFVSLKSVSAMFHINIRLSSPPKMIFISSLFVYFLLPDARRRPFEEKSSALTHPEWPFPSWEYNVEYKSKRCWT
jgi:hypothetical protein